MRKVLCVLACTLGIMTVGCGNRQMIDTSFTFKYATVDGVDYEIASWKDFEGSDMVQFKTTDGTVYMTHSSKVVFRSK